MSGYIIHFDNETELAHYGVKGMKWGKRIKSFAKSYNELSNISRKEIQNRQPEMQTHAVATKDGWSMGFGQGKGKTVKIDGHEAYDEGTRITYDRDMSLLGKYTINQILKKRYTKMSRYKGQSIFRRIIADAKFKVKTSKDFLGANYKSIPNDYSSGSGGRYSD